MGNPGRMLIRSGSDGKDLLAQRPISALQKSVTKLASRCLNSGSIKHHCGIVKFTMMIVIALLISSCVGVLRVGKTQGGGVADVVTFGDGGDVVTGQG